MSGPADPAARPPDGPDILHAEFDWAVVPPSRAVVETVAIAADRAAVGLPPLIEAIDPDALDDLFEHAVRRDRDLRLSFSLSEYTVTVTESGDVFVHFDGSEA